jgi:hypothetical protein
LDKSTLRERVAALSLEIRSYPTPIARCDLHLPALLEERAQLMSQLNSLEEKPACSAEALWANDGGFDAA